MYHVQNRHKIFRFGPEFRPADTWMVRCSESKDLTYASALDARTQCYSEMLLLTSSSLEIVGLMQGSCHFVREDCITITPPKKQQLANVHHRALITQWIGLIVLVLHNHNCSPFSAITLDLTCQDEELHVGLLVRVTTTGQPPSPHLVLYERGAGA